MCQQIKNQNITPSQKELLKRKFRLGHIGFQNLKWLVRNECVKVQEIAPRTLLIMTLQGSHNVSLENIIYGIVKPWIWKEWMEKIWININITFTLYKRYHTTIINKRYQEGCTIPEVNLIPRQYNKGFLLIPKTSGYLYASHQVSLNKM